VVINDGVNNSFLRIDDGVVAVLIVRRIGGVVVRNDQTHPDLPGAVDCTAAAAVDCAAVESSRMERINKPKRGSNNTWTYPRSKDVLEECGLETIDTYIKKRRDTIAQYVATQPIFTQCLDGEQRRGSMPRQWWWEQPMSLDDDDADVP
jgi:hypothetical protein